MLFSPVKKWKSRRLKTSKTVGTRDCHQFAKGTIIEGRTLEKEEEEKLKQGSKVLTTAGKKRKGVHQNYVLEQVARKKATFIWKTQKEGQ